MSKKRFVLESLTGLMMLVTLIISGVYAANQYHEVRSDEVVFIIDNQGDMSLLNNDDLRETIAVLPGCCEGNKRGEINIAMLEESVDAHPMVKKSEVFSSLKGTLYIRANVKSPVVRVFDGKRSYYLDELGEPFPLSSRYTKPVMLLTGDVDQWEREVLMDLVGFISEDAFFRDRIGGIHIEENGQAVLYPVGLSFNIRLGTHPGMKGKLEKLRTFWLNALDEEKASKLNDIDLRFNRQVVCQY
ncbi:MAG: hypothetical protein LAT54_06460 [Cryomorphaceae bacterium]|nr:hypothetical protein [Cryomorphaceae bacterium]